MHSLFRSVLAKHIVRAFIVFAALIGILASAHARQRSDDVPNRYRIECDTLKLVKSDKVTSITFGGGVVLKSNDGLSISADNGLIEVVSRVVEEGLSVGERFAEKEAASVNPKLKLQNEDWSDKNKSKNNKTTKTESEQGSLPKISPDDIKRLELSGNVVLTSHEGTLECEVVYSEDGGRTWKTRGASKFTGSGENTGTKFGANTLELDSARGILSGAGGVKIAIPANGAGKRKRDSEAAESKFSSAIIAGDINVSASAFKFDIEKNVLTLTAKPVVTQKNGKITAGSLVYYGDTGRIAAEDGVRIEYPEKHIVATADKANYGADGKVMFSGNVRVEQTDKENTLTCGEIVYVEQTGDVKARENVKLDIPSEKMTLSADTLEGSIPRDSGTAKGNPVITRNGSSVKGEEIRYKRESDRIVVEVLGGDNTEYVIDPKSFEGK